MRSNCSYGNAILKGGDVLGAFSYLYDCGGLINELNDESAILKCKNLYFDKLSDYYVHIGVFDKAKQYKIEELEFINSHLIVDSIKLMWTKFEILHIIHKSKSDEDIMARIDEIIDYASKTKNEKLRSFALALYRTNLMDRDDLKGIIEFYTVKYPEEFEKLQKNKPTFCKISGLICEGLNDLDSAIVYFEMEEQLHIDNRDSHFLANYYLRRGEFHLRHDQLSLAKEFLKKSYDIIVLHQYSSSGKLLSLSKLLQDVEVKLGNYKEAYLYGLSTINSLKQENEKLDIADDIVKLEIKSEEQQKKLQQSYKDQEKQKKHKLQYFGIGIAILVLLVIMVFISSMQVPIWVIQMLGFFNILFVWEFIIILLDHRLIEITHGEPIKLFGMKVVIISILFPLHHVVEKVVTNYLIKHKLISSRTRSGFFNAFKKLWPWLEQRKFPNGDEPK